MSFILMVSWFHSAQNTKVWELFSFWLYRCQVEHSAAPFHRRSSSCFVSKLVGTFIIMSNFLALKLRQVACGEPPASIRAEHRLVKGHLLRLRPRLQFNIFSTRSPGNGSHYFVVLFIIEHSNYSVIIISTYPKRSHFIKRSTQHFGCFNKYLTSYVGNDPI